MWRKLEWIASSQSLSPVHQGAKELFGSRTKDLGQLDIQYNAVMLQ